MTGVYNQCEWRFRRLDVQALKWIVIHNHSFDTACIKKKNWWWHDVDTDRIQSPKIGTWRSHSSSYISLVARDYGSHWRLIWDDFSPVLSVIRECREIDYMCFRWMHSLSSLWWISLSLIHLRDCKYTALWGENPAQGKYWTKPNKVWEEYICTCGHTFYWDMQYYLHTYCRYTIQDLAAYMKTASLQK